MSRRSGSRAGKIVAIILAAILGAGAVLGIIFRKQVAIMWGDLMRYFKRVDDEVPKDSANNGSIDDEGYIPSDDANIGNMDEYAGVIVEPGESYLLTDSITFLASDLKLTETGEFEPISVDLYAKVLPYGVSQEVTWGLEFVNPESDWAKGKSLTDYMTIQAKSDAVNAATLTCKYPFGEQIKIICTSVEDAAIKDECTVDITKRFKNVVGSIGDIPLNFGGITDVTVELYRYADYVPGGDITVDIEYYPYTIGADFDLYCAPHTLGYYFGDEKQYSGQEYSTTRDGYLVIDGVDYALYEPDAIEPAKINFDWYLLNEFRTLDGDVGVQGLPSWFHDYEKMVNAFNNIENGYLCCFVVELYTRDETSKTLYGEFKTLINIAGYTYTPKVENVELGDDGVVI